MELLSDNRKIDVAVAPASLATTYAVGQYFPMDKYRRALFLVNAAAMATGKTVVAQVYQATDADPGSAKVITNAAATITADTKVKKATVTLATLLAGSTVVINGLTFTAHATVTTYANREFSISGNDTADAAELVLCINHATYGVPGVTATSNLGVVTLVATEPGEQYITVVGTASTGVAATVEAEAFVEIDASMLDTTNGFDHVALRLTTTATIVAGAMLIRDCRYTPTQYVAASKTDVA